MLLFIDETENDDLFLVGGLLVDSREDATSAYKQFKHRIRDFKISASEKALVYTEFKSTILDKRFQRIKIKMLEEINNLNSTIIFSVYVKEKTAFTQTVKEKTYISLLSRIIASIEDDLSVIFDTFNMAYFEEQIIKTISEFPHVQAIMARDSQAEPGLQFADNICSVLRRHKTLSSEDQFFPMIKKHVQEV